MTSRPTATADDMPDALPTSPLARGCTLLVELLGHATPA
jgi:hypothetical protein